MPSQKNNFGSSKIQRYGGFSLSLIFKEVVPANTVFTKTAIKPADFYFGSAEGFLSSNETSTWLPANCISDAR